MGIVLAILNVAFVLFVGLRQVRAELRRIAEALERANPK